MLSTPYAQPVAPDDDHPARESNRQYAERRLKDTPWSRAVTVRLYAQLVRLGGAIGSLGVSADSLTLGSLALAASSALLIGFGHFWSAALVVLLSGALDVLDGAVARATGRASRYGALLDSTVDRLSDALPLIGVMGFYLEEGRVALVPALAMLPAFVISYVRARAENLGATLPPLFMRRAERVVLLVIALLAARVDFPGLGVPAPLLLLGVAGIGVMTTAAAWYALRSARVALSAPRAPSLSEPGE